MTGGDVAALAVAAVGVVGSAVLSGAEAALARVTRVRALAWAEEGRRGARRLARLLESPDRPLAMVVVLRMAARTGASTAVAVVGWRHGGWGGAVLAVVALVAVVVVVGEFLPRRLGVRHPERVARWAAGPLAAVGSVPLLAALAAAVTTTPAPGARHRANGHADHDESEPGGNGDAEGDIASEEELIHSIFEFGDTIVREVMVPRTDMVTIDAASSIDDALDVAISGGFSRLPVHEESQDNVVGLVHVKDLFRASRQGRGTAPATDLMRRAVFVPEQKRVAELLREMQTRKVHMAVAVDEYGDVAGLVTLEDLLEEIVGEIEDEYDVEEPRVEELAGGVLRVAGRTPIDEINELLGVELPDEEWDTVGGLVFDLVGHVPAEGEPVSLQGIEFVAERVQGRRIVSVLVKAPASQKPGTARAQATGP
jgi:CBS domain containing-hemolysin-like protein